MVIISVVISLDAYISDLISAQLLEWNNLEDMILFVIDFTSNDHFFLREKSDAGFFVNSQ